MNLAGTILRVHMPDFVRRRALRDLFQATAGAFGVPAPSLTESSAGELLEQYAIFTREQATAALQSGKDLAPVRQRLFDSAYAMGARLRHDLGVTSTADAMAAARVVYGILRIDFRPAAKGEVHIPHCYFSRFYSPAVCELISALDQGLVGGLTAGGRLEFRQRITEGASCCLAGFAEAA